MNNATETKTIVFVYGTLKQGHGNHRVLSNNDAEFVGNATTTESVYRMGNTGGFPEVTCDGESKIVGEIYAVDDLCVAQLDRLESNGHMYDREQRRITIDETGEVVEAWIYIWLLEKTEEIEPVDGLVSWN